MNKKLFNNFALLFLGFSVLLLTGCRNKESDIKNGSEFTTEYNNLYLLNVNDAESYQDASIKGSINIALDDIEKKFNKVDKDANFIVYCSNYACTESDRVAKALNKLGFNNVKVYQGGIQEWYQLSLKNPKQYPFIGPATQKFLHKPIEKLEPNAEIPIIEAKDLSVSLMQSKEK